MVKSSSVGIELKVKRNFVKTMLKNCMFIFYLTNVSFIIIYHIYPVLKHKLRCSNTTCQEDSVDLSTSREELTGPRREITCLPGFANNTGTDQPAHLRSLIRHFYSLFRKYHM